MSRHALKEIEIHGSAGEVAHQLNHEATVTSEPGVPGWSQTVAVGETRCVFEGC